MGQRYRVIRPHRAAYEDPILLHAGDEVRVGQEYRDNPEWEDWVWCTSLSSTKSGWVPKQYLSISRGRGVALLDYSARELSISSGQIVEVEKIDNGWAWARDDQSIWGWIPTSHLGPPQNAPTP